MSTGLKQFVQYQPFTPVTETVRHLLAGGPVARHAITVVDWSVGITVVAYLWQSPPGLLTDTT